MTFPAPWRHEHIGDRVIDHARHRIVHDLDRLSLRFGRAGDHVEPFERRSFERARLGLRVQCELHAERLADSDRQRRISLKSDLLGSRCREGSPSTKSAVRDIFAMKSLIELYNKTFFQILQRKLLPVSISAGRFLMLEIGKKIVAFGHRR